MSAAWACGHPCTAENTEGKKAPRCKTCRQAYMRAYRAGMIPKPPKTIAGRIERRTQPGSDGCLIWTGARDSDGYPKIAVVIDGARRHRQVHRLYWEQVNGPIPDGYELARNGCENRRCIAPEHMVLNEYKGKAGRIACDQNIDKTVYKCGHPRTEENTYKGPGRPYGECKTCSKIRSRARCKAYRARKRAATYPPIHAEIMKAA